MANAKKCDRCGKYYEIKLIQRYRGIGLTDKSGYLYQENDICANCIIDFKRFMSGKAIPALNEIDPSQEVTADANQTLW